MKKLLTSLLLGTVLLCQAAAQNAIQRHQVRLGWGDMLFETLAFHEGASHSSDLVRKSDFSYTGHIFLEYQYRLTSVVSLGIQTDLEGIFWKETPTNAYREPVGPAVPSRNYDLSILPTLRLTFLNSRYVQLYAGFATGLMVAFDNARKVEAAPIVSLVPFGVQAGKGHWSGSLELGGLISARSANDIYMLGSRLVSVSVNYSW